MGAAGRHREAVQIQGYVKGFMPVAAMGDTAKNLP